MSAHGIDAVIAKNSGGVASYGKIAAARALGIEVIMLRRPAPTGGPAVETVDEMIAWLDHAIASATVRGTARGV
jgi:precorrin-6A/cobalt-precorrin-6A reductase